MQSNPATAAVPSSGRFYRETPDMTAWLHQLNGWRIVGCPGDAPAPPDLARAIEVWQDGHLEGYCAMYVHDYDMRGVDLSDQSEAIVSDYRGKHPRIVWHLLGCTMPGDAAPLYGWADIHNEMHRSITRLLGITRGESNQHVMEVLDELLHPVAQQVASALTSLIVRKSGPCSAPEVE